MIEDIERMSGTRLGPGTLYGAITRLEEQKLIEPLPPEARRYHRLRYPRAWRRRYGDEFRAFLENSPASVSSVFNVIWGASPQNFAPVNIVPHLSPLSVSATKSFVSCGDKLGQAAPIYLHPRRIKIRRPPKNIRLGFSFPGQNIERCA